jgi:hypothetical protein
VEVRVHCISSEPWSEHDWAQADGEIGWRELWPAWVAFGVLIAIGIVGMHMMFPTPAPPKTLEAGQDLTLDLAGLEPAKVHLFAYPVTPQNQVEFFVGHHSGLCFLPSLLPLRRVLTSGMRSARVVGRILQAPHSFSIPSAFYSSDHGGAYPAWCIVPTVTSYHFRLIASESTELQRIVRLP